MAKRKSFADDGWAIWVTGDDTSTFYLNEWVNPQGKSYVDVSVRIRGIKCTHDLNIYIPFEVKKEEVEDLSHHLRNENIFRAIFSTRCIMDYMKNRIAAERANLDNWEQKIKDDQAHLAQVKAQRVEDLLSGEAAKKHKAAKKAWKKQMRQIK